MGRYHEAGDLAPRDVVARSIVRENAQEPGGVFLTLAHLDAARVRARFPTIAAMCAGLGLDLATDPIPVGPAAHYLMGGIDTDTVGILALLAWWGIFLAFAIKVPTWPFHTWLPDAHTEAPTAGSVILAGVLLKMGGYGMFRILLPLLPDQSYQMRYVLLVMAIVSAPPVPLTNSAAPVLEKIELPLTVVVVAGATTEMPAPPLLAMVLPAAAPLTSRSGVIRTP